MTAGNTSYVYWRVLAWPVGRMTSPLTTMIPMRDYERYERERRRRRIITAIFAWAVLSLAVLGAATLIWLWLAILFSLA